MLLTSKPLRAMAADVGKTTIQKKCEYYLYKVHHTQELTADDADREDAVL